MVERDVLVNYTNKLLKLHEYADYGAMGLQFKGTAQVNKIACAVSISKEVIELAALIKADTLIVHHGMFWNNESRLFDERVGGRIKLLEKYNINVLAYHLALDAHKKYGNNILATRALSLSSIKPWQDIAWIGEYLQPMPKQTFVKKIDDNFGPEVPICYWNHPNMEIKKVAVCVGGAAHYIVDAHRSGADTFFTGETAEPTLGIAQDLKMNFVGAGHHNTEKNGVVHLSRHLARKFHVPFDFIDIPNQV